MVIMQWLQFIDPIESKETDEEEDNYHESVSCAFLINETFETKGIHL
jgi:hypothetical protein